MNPETKKEMEMLVMQEMTRKNHDRFVELAMESPENFKMAMEIKKNRNIELSGNPYSPIYALGYTLPWIADPDIKFLRFEEWCAPDLGTWEGGRYRIAVYDVHGIEKACTDWDKNMNPRPYGNAYENSRM